MKINPKNTKDLRSMGIIKKGFLMAKRGLKIKTSLKMLSAQPRQNILVNKSESLNAIKGLFQNFNLKIECSASQHRK